MGVVAAVQQVATSLPSWPSLGAGGILAISVMMILTGRLVPRRSLKDMQQQADKWEQAWEKSQSTVTELSQQVTALTEIGRTTESLLHAILEAQKDRSHQQKDNPPAGGWKRRRSDQKGDNDDGDNVVKFNNGTT